MKYFLQQVVVGVAIVVAAHYVIKAIDNANTK